MQKAFIGILLVVVVVVLFAFNNNQPVNVDFWFWQINTNLSMVIFISITFGALISFILSLPHRAKKNKALKGKNEQIKILEKELSTIKPQQEETLQEKEKQIS
jgi:lipopolysaccharide assembly protein A